jgi:hypothetical protein
VVKNTTGIMRVGNAFAAIAESTHHQAAKLVHDHRLINLHKRQMKTAIITKVLEFEPMTLGAYNEMRGWSMPENEDANRDGFLLKHSDDYLTWSPKEVFEETCRQLDNGTMNFGQAIHFAKLGKKIARNGWNGKGMFAYMVDGSRFQVNRAPLNSIFEEGTTVDYRPHIDLKAVDGTCGVWNPNMMDILAEDWVIVD